MRDCWIGISLEQDSGLILAARAGKHTNYFIEELVINTEGKTDCKYWNTDSWGGYERVLSEEYNPHFASCIALQTNFIQNHCFEMV